MVENVTDLVQRQGISYAAFNGRNPDLSVPHVRLSGKLRVARDLIGFDNLLNPPDVLLSETIRAYAIS